MQILNHENQLVIKVIKRKSYKYRVVELDYSLI